jgi:hypothetical protein
MLKRSIWVGILLAMCACKSQQKREQETACAATEMMIVDGLKQQLTGKAMSPEQQAMADKLIANAKKNWKSYCNSLTQADLDCMSSGKAFGGDPACAHIKTDIMTKVYGM